MDNKTYQRQYRKNKRKAGWKHFSVLVPPNFYIELKGFYLKWKLDNLAKESINNEK